MQITLSDVGYTYPDAVEPLFLMSPLHFLKAGVAFWVTMAAAKLP